MNNEDSYKARSCILSRYSNAYTWQDKYKFAAFDRFQDAKGYKLYISRLSVKCFKGQGLPDTLTWAERGRIAELATHMTYDNLLFYRSDNDVKPLTPAHMAEILDMSDRGIHRFLNAMIKEGVIGKRNIYIDSVPYLGYFINPSYFFAGKWLTPQLYLLFKRDMDRYLPSWVITRFALVIGRQRQQIKTASRTKRASTDDT